MHDYACDVQSNMKLSNKFGMHFFFKFLRVTSKSFLKITTNSQNSNIILQYFLSEEKFGNRVLGNEDKNILV